MRIIKNLAQHKLVVLMVVVLLCVQAACDLALPNYTSDIVDTGIQQQGVQDVAAEQLTERTHDLVAMMLPESDEQMFADAYTQNEDGTYLLTEAGKRDRAALDDAMALPMTVTCYADQIAELDLEQVKSAYDQGMIGKDDIQAMLDRARGSMGDMADTLIAQQGLAAARAEYEQLGYDLDAMQMDYLAATGAKMLGLAALGMVIAVMVGFLASRTAAKVGRSLRERLFNQVVGFSDAEIQSFSAASLITRGTNDVQLVQMVTVMLLRMVLYAPILAIGGIIMIARTDLSMGWIIIAAVAAIAVIMGVLMKVAMPKFKIMQKLIDRVNLVSRELLTGLPVIRAFGREQHEEARFDDANTRLMKTQLFTNRVMTFMMPLMMLIMNLVSVGIIWFGGHAIDAGNLQTGDLIAFITYSMVIIMGFLMIGMLSIMLPRADVAAQRIDEVLECKPSIADPEPGKAKDALLGANGLPGARIAFENVSFRYSDGAECVLEDVSFTCEPGKTTAIIGSTGSGKSTVLKLAERFHDVTSGRITVDGIDVRDVSQHVLRTQLGYVPQAAFLFSGTIASNVGYGVDDADEDRIRAAADVAQASDFIAERPEGLATPISQGGTNVSGGQRQRLAIARALAKKPEVVVFDDSFSALDYKTDARLREELAKNVTDAALVVVAQRIATIMHADQIIVLDDGHVVGTGTHEELLRSCPAYLEIAQSQLSAEELGLTQEEIAAVMEGGER